MSKMSKSLVGKENSKRVQNYMGGTSYELNPIDTLRIVTASSVFGEPQYYREGEWAQKGVIDGIFRQNNLSEAYSIFKDFDGKKTSTIMEEVIDAALDYDFEATLQWAVRLRKEFLMRLNPQVIMVRAAMHPKREEFTKTNPGKFHEYNNQVMSRMDEPSAQLTYWLFKHKSKNKIPSLLKRSWAKKLESGTKYQIAKYKNANVGIIDTVRISHASSVVLNELMKNGNIELEDNESTWEKLRSSGKTWREIINTIEIPHMALLRNLRGIFSEISDRDIVVKLLNQLKDGVLKGKQFPFRYYSAYQVISNDHNVNHKSLILDALEECISLARNNMPKLKGKTMCLSDNSGSAHGAFTSEYGTVNVAQIGNLSSFITAQNSDEGYVGLFGDNLKVLPALKSNGTLAQAQQANREGREVGMGTENGVWLFFKQAINKKEHWDNIFIYSDMQAGHGGLYVTHFEEKELKKGKYNVEYTSKYIDVNKLVETYRKTVNPKVNVFCIQTAGYNNVLIPENQYRGSILYGWTGNELVYADLINKFWDEKEGIQ